jgi:Arm DNA-binding domain
MAFKLTALDVERLHTSGRYPDGGGLYLQITGNSAKSWLFRYAVNGKEHWLGLGPVRDVSLRQARHMRDVERGKIAAGADPARERHAERAATKAAKTPTLTFRRAAARYFDDHHDEWSSAKYRQQWLTTLVAHAYPVIGDLPVAEITANHVVEMLRPVWRVPGASAVESRPSSTMPPIPTTRISATRRR